MEPGTITQSEIYQGHAEKITDSARIIGLLVRTKENRALLSVMLPKSGKLYNTAILEIQPDAGYLILDELNPKSGHDQLLIGHQLRLYTRLKGVEMSFESRLESAGANTEGAFYRVTLPDILNYRQQRTHYRAKASAAQPVTVLFTRPDGTKLKGQLHDISVGGIGIRFTGRIPPDIDTGARISNCVIELPSDEEIFCEIEVRFTSFPIHGDGRMMGARFVHLSHVQQGAIARFVAALDREQQRKSHREGY